MERLPRLGCHADGQRVEGGLVRFLTVKARVRPSAVVEVQIAADRLSRFADIIVGPQVDRLIFDAAPQSFNEHIVPPGVSVVLRPRL